MQSSFKLTYLGNSAFELRSETGVRLLFDPHITGNEMCPIKLEDIEKPDLILVSHGNRDHLGDTLEIAKKSDCCIISDPMISKYLLKRGLPKERLLSMAWGGVREFKGLRIRSLESRHISFIENQDPFTIGMPMGFIVYTESNIRIYHLGDTSIFSDLRLFGELYQPQIGLVPVGNYPGFRADLPPNEAALSVKWLGLKITIPMHYEKGSNDPKLFAEFVEKESPETQVLIMHPGEKKVFDSKNMNLI